MPLLTRQPPHRQQLRYCNLSIVTLASCILLALIVAPTTHALYEEQIGQTDWHVSHIGGVTHAHIRNVQSNSVIVGTSANVIASVSLGKDGETKWRQVLPENEQLRTLASYSDARVVSLSKVEDNGYVRVWSSKDGSMIWDTPLLTSDSLNRTARSLALHKRRVQGLDDSLDFDRTNPFAFRNADIITVADVTTDSKRDIAVLNEGAVTMLNGVDGTTVWTWNSPAETFQAVRLLAFAEGRIAVIGSDGVDARVFLLDHKDGSQISNRKFDLPHAFHFSQRNVIIAHDSLLILNAKGVQCIPLFGGSISNIEVPDATNMELIDSSSSGEAEYVAVYTPEQQIILELAGKECKKVNTFTSQPDEDVEFGIGANKDVVRAKLSKGKLSIETTPIGGTKAAPVLSSTPFTNRGGLKQLWVDEASAGKHAPRVLLSCVDDSFTLVQFNAIQWTREEALATITNLQFVELPVGGDDVDDESSGSYPNFFQRIIPQIRSISGSVLGLANPIALVDKVEEVIRDIQGVVQSFSGGAVSTTKVPTTSFARPLSKRDDELTQDYFGFRKLLLVNTACGKVYALESNSGSVVWSKFMQISGGGEHEEDEQVTPAWRLHVISHHEAVAIVRDELQKKTELVAFNPLSGELIKGASMTLDFIVSTSIALPIQDAHNRRLLLLASGDEKPEVRVFPNTQEAKELLHRKAGTVFFYTVDIKNQLLRGFNLQVRSNKINGHFTAVETWKLHFPSDREEIVSIVSRASNEVIQSSVRILGGGDGGYLYKYLNPNLIAIATIRSLSPNTADLRVVPSLKRTTDPSVNLYLLDTVTGNVLDKFVHRGCEGPVTVVQSENSILYHYYNAQTYMYEVSSIELYETRDGTSAASGTGSNTVVPISGTIFDGLTVASLSSIGRSRVAPFSSFDEPPPQSLQQTFTVKSAIKSLGVTQTRRGITMKEYLIGLPTDQLFALPKMLVDPRRPLGEPTPLDRAEGLIPYTSELPLDPLRIVSHAHQIGQLRSTVSSNSLLESTSLVCAYGIDLYCTRLTPSQTFDLLNEDFNSPFLIATVSAVFLAILFTRRLAKAKELKAAWK